MAELGPQASQKMGGPRTRHPTAVHVMYAIAKDWFEICGALSDALVRR